MTESSLQSQESGRKDLADWQATRQLNPFTSDPFFQRLLERQAGTGYEALSARCRDVGERLGAEFAAAVRESNRNDNLPAVRGHDSLGRATEEVVFHPATHDAGAVFWGSGVLSVLAEPGNEVASGALAYLVDQQGEGGHACPVACSAGAIKLLQRIGSEEQRERYLPGLLSDDYDTRLHAAQFVTEVQGGSDVGLNACVASPDADRPGWWRISGEKWFCSVADAGLFVVSARPEGAEPGTRGLALFLLPRVLDGRPNGFRLRRLKDKLGTRSMATGEIEFDGALGEPIGRLEDGFRNLVSIVLDTSRVHNALAACGAMRGALVESWEFARRRRAFDRPVAEFPAMQELLAGMKLRLAAALATTFRILAMSDRLDRAGGDPALTGARRISVMINKYWTAVACTATVRDGIEVLGGNGTIEDLSPLPRLYRDAIVIESWEGTHNTLCAQVLRDMAARGLHRPWLEVIDGEIASLEDGGEVEEAVVAGRLRDEVAARIEQLLGGDERAAAAGIRHVVDRMCRLTDWVALAVQFAWDRRRSGGECEDLLQMYRLKYLEREDPLTAPKLVDVHRRLASTR
jgi:acyl-CoA dehydrogenase